MDSNYSSSEDLKTIRKMMEESTRFLSLSGLSGIFAGIFAIAGAAIAWFLILERGAVSFEKSLLFTEDAALSSAGWLLIIDAITILVAALIISVWLSVRKAGSSGANIWAPVSKRLMINLLIPLATGGLLSIILLAKGFPGLLIPCLLIFYGLALVNAAKFTLNEVFYLGLAEIATGLVAACFPGFWIFFWVTGFGLLHIIYGVILFRKYES